MRTRLISGFMAWALVSIGFGLGGFSLGANQLAVQCTELRIWRER